MNESAVLKVDAARVTAVTRHGELPGQTGRRSEIGSHTPPKTSIFIRGGDLIRSCGTFMGIGRQGKGGFIGYQLHSN